MKRLLALLLVSVFFVSCAAPRAWTKDKKMAAGFFLTGLGADMYSTKKLVDEPDKFRETNSFLGDHPSDSDIAVYTGIVAGLILFICHYWPEGRMPILTIGGLIEFGCAYHNYDLMD